MIDTIEERRREAGISQKALCKAADVHATTYSKIKQGESGGQLRTLQKLAAALDRLIEERAAA